MKIDVYNHILPKPYFDKMTNMSEKGAYMMKRVTEIPMLYDVNARFEKINQFGEDYVQILSLNLPPIEVVAGPEDSPELARIANDGMAEVCDQHRDRFPGFVAAVPMNNVEAAVEEIDRAINKLGAKGIQINSNVAGAPLDDPALEPIWKKMAEHDLPIWLHPTRAAADIPDYRTEERSYYDMWWVFGWPYETSVAMGRLVFSGIFDRYPDIKIIAHHLGGMIPYFDGRIGPGLDQLGARSDDPTDVGAKAKLAKRPYEYFHMFYADTAVFGSIPATECGLAFFGSDRVLFASDAPFDPEKGSGYIRETLRVIDNITTSRDDRYKIYEGNAKRLLKLDI